MIKFIFNKSFILSLFFLLIQQSIVAVSTYTLIRLGFTESLAFNNEQLWLLGIFIACLFIVYIPDVIAMVLLDRSKYLAFDSYMQVFENNHFSQAQIYADKSARANIEPIIANESRIIIDEYATFLYDFCSLALNVVLNILVLGFALDKGLMLLYVLGFALLSSVVFLSNSNIVRAADKFQKARQNLSNILLYAWDNITLGNSANFKAWHNSFSKSSDSAREHSVTHLAKLRSFSALAVIVGLLPIVIGAWLLIKHQHNLLWPIVVTLHRQVLIVQHFQLIALYCLSFSSLKQRSKLCTEILSLSSNNKLHDLVSWGDLKFSYKHKSASFASLEQLANFIKEHNNGILSIKGPNGVGKSSLMLLLKKRLNDAAIYLPAHSHLFFKNINNITQESTGNLKIEQLKAVFDSEKVLLLDEWNANLDNSNVELMSKLIESYSENNLVVEVIHR